MSTAENILETTVEPAVEAAAESPPTSAVFDEGAVERTRRRILNPFLMRLFMLAKLPLGLIAGMKILSLTTARCRTTLPYGWRTTNPFRSMYFAAQSMAAEMSTGALAVLAVENAPAPVAMLIVGLEAEFSKKADRRTTFTCEDGDKIFAAVRRTLDSGEPAVVRAESVGTLPDGTEVSRFTFTWSFKKR